MSWNTSHFHGSSLVAPLVWRLKSRYPPNFKKAYDLGLFKIKEYLDLGLFKNKGAQCSLLILLIKCSIRFQQFRNTEVKVQVHLYLNLDVNVLNPVFLPEDHKEFYKN